MNAQMTIRYSVPQMADSMPERSGKMREGNDVRKSVDSTGTPSLATSASSVASARTVSPTAPYMSPRNTAA
jgi:hypothetical protein